MSIKTNTNFIYFL